MAIEGRISEQISERDVVVVGVRYIFQRLLPFEEGTSYEAKLMEPPLAPPKWLYDNELSPEMARHGDPSQIRELMAEGIKPRNMIIVRLGR